MLSRSQHFAGYGQVVCSTGHRAAACPDKPGPEPEVCARPLRHRLASLPERRLTEHACPFNNELLSRLCPPYFHATAWSARCLSSVYPSHDMSAALQRDSHREDSGQSYRGVKAGLDWQCLFLENRLSLSSFPGLGNRHPASFRLIAGVTLASDSPIHYSEKNDRGTTPRIPLV